jgi:hypothetical protein
LVPFCFSDNIKDIKILLLHIYKASPVLFSVYSHVDGPETMVFAASF